MESVIIVTELFICYYLFQLWLALSDRYLQTRNVDWKKEQEKCFSETWGADDQELGIQIVKVRLYSKPMMFLQNTQTSLMGRL